MADFSLRFILGTVGGEQLAELKRNLRELPAEVPKTSKALESLGKQATALGGAVQKVGIVLTAFSLAIATLGGVAIKSATDFESSFAGVRKTVDATEAQFATLEGGLRSLAKQIPLDVNEINAIAEAGGQLGVGVDDLESFTSTMADLGATTNMSANEAATSLARFANVMDNDLGPQYDRLGSVIVDLGNNFATTEAEITHFGQRLVGAGKVAGLSEADILGLSAALSSVGVNAEAGGTAFSKVMINISAAVAKGGEDVAAYARIAGMSGRVAAEDFATAWKEKPAEALVAFVEGLGKVHEAGGDLFGTLEQLGISEQRMRNALLLAAGAGDLMGKAVQRGNTAWKENRALTDEASKRYETLAAQAKILWNQVKDVAITIGQAFIPALKAAISALKTLTPYLDAAAQWFKNLPNGVKVAIGVLGLLAAAIGPVVAGIGTLLVALGPIISAWGALSAGISTALGAFAAIIGPVIAAAAPILGVAAAVTAVATAAWAGTRALIDWGDRLTGLDEAANASISAWNSFVFVLEGLWAILKGLGGIVVWVAELWVDLHKAVFDFLGITKALELALGLGKAALEKMALAAAALSKAFYDLGEIMFRVEETKLPEGAQLLMLAQASKIAGREITNLAEAQKIVIENARKITEQRRAAAGSGKGSGKQETEEEKRIRLLREQAEAEVRAAEARDKAKKLEKRVASEMLKLQKEEEQALAQHLRGLDAEIAKINADAAAYRRQWDALKIVGDQRERLEALLKNTTAAKKAGAASKIIADEAERAAKEQMNLSDALRVNVDELFPDYAKVMEDSLPPGIAVMGNLQGQAKRVKENREQLRYLIENKELVIRLLQSEGLSLDEATKAYDRNLESIEKNSEGSSDLASKIRDISSVVTELIGFLNELGVAGEEGSRGADSLAALGDYMSSSSDLAKAMSEGDVAGIIQGAIGMAKSLWDIGQALWGIRPAEEAAKEALRDFGVTISEELAQEIADLAEEVGGRFQAMLLSITDIAEDSGEPLSSFGSNIVDLMNAIEMGVVPAQEGMEQLGEIFEGLAEEEGAFTANGQLTDRMLQMLASGSIDGAEAVDLLSDAFRGLGADMRAGVEGAAEEFNRVWGRTLEQFQAGNLSAAETTEVLGEAFDEVLGLVESGAAGARVQMLDLIRQTREAGLELEGMSEYISDGLNRAATGAEQAFKGLQITRPGDAEAQAHIFAATYWAKVKEEGIMAAAESMKPAWEALQQNLAAGGFDSAAADAILAPIRGMMDLVSNEATAPIAEGIQGLQQALGGLADSGYMTQDSFIALQEQAISAYDQLVAAGVAPKDALAAVAPLLGDLKQAADDYGMSLGANTQALLDEAEASGLAFQTDPMNQMVDLLAELVTVMGGELPDSVREAQTAFQEMGTATADAMEVAKMAADGTQESIREAMASADGVRDALADGGQLLAVERVPGAAGGAVVNPTPGGTMYNVGEGGSSELIAPVAGLAREIGAGLAKTLVDAAGGREQAPQQVPIAVNVGGEKIFDLMLERSKTGHFRIHENALVKD